VRGDSVEGYTIPKKTRIISFWREFLQVEGCTILQRAGVVSFWREVLQGGYHGVLLELLRFGIFRGFLLGGSHGVDKDFHLLKHCWIRLLWRRFECFALFRWIFEGVLVEFAVWREGP